MGLMQPEGLRLPSAPRLPRLPRDSVRNALIGLGAALVAVLIGLMIAQGKWWFGFLPVVIVAPFVLARYSWLPYALAVVLICGFAEPYAYPQLIVAAANIHLVELALMLAFAGWFLSTERRRAQLREHPYLVRVGVGLVMVAAFVGLGVGIDNGATPVGAFLDMRPMLIYSAFWLALLAFADPASRRIIFPLFAALGVGVVVMQVLQGFLGTGKIIFLTDDPRANLLTCSLGVCADVSAYGFPRVRPPGLPIAYAGSAFAACYLLWGPPRRRALVAGLLGVYLVGIVVSQNRNMLIGLALGLIVASIVSVHKARLVIGFVVLLGAILLLVTVLGDKAGTSSPIITRITSLTEPEEISKSSTISDRSTENELALAAIRKAPLEGLGWGVNYGEGNIHLQYLALWLRMGLLGLAAFVVVLIASFCWAFQACRVRGPDSGEYPWLGAAVLSSLVALAASAVVGIYFLTPASAVVLCGIFALASTLRRELGERRERVPRRSALPRAV